MIFEKPKRLFFLPVVAAFCACLLAMTAQADDHFDGGAGVGDPSWGNALNWDSGTVPPGSTLITAINVPGYGVVVNNPAIK